MTTTHERNSEAGLYYLVGVTHREIAARVKLLRLFDAEGQRRIYDGL